MFLGTAVCAGLFDNWQTYIWWRLAFGDILETRLVGISSMLQSQEQEAERARVVTRTSTPMRAG